MISERSKLDQRRNIQKFHSRNVERRLSRKVPKLQKILQDSSEFWVQLQVGRSRGWRQGSTSLDFFWWRASWCSKVILKKLSDEVTFLMEELMFDTNAFYSWCCDYRVGIYMCITQKYVNPWPRYTDIRHVEMREPCYPNVGQRDWNFCVIIFLRYTRQSF